MNITTQPLITPSSSIRKSLMGDANSCVPPQDAATEGRSSQVRRSASAADFMWTPSVPPDVPPALASFSMPMLRHVLVVHWITTDLFGVLVEKPKLLLVVGESAGCVMLVSASTTVVSAEIPLCHVSLIESRLLAGEGAVVVSLHCRAGNCDLSTLKFRVKSVNEWWLLCAVLRVLCPTHRKLRLFRRGWWKHSPFCFRCCGATCGVESPRNWQEEQKDD